MIPELRPRTGGGCDPAAVACTCVSGFCLSPWPTLSGFSRSAASDPLLSTKAWTPMVPAASHPFLPSTSATARLPPQSSKRPRPTARPLTLCQLATSGATCSRGLLPHAPPLRGSGPQTALPLSPTGHWPSPLALLPRAHADHPAHQATPRHAQGARLGITTPVRGAEHWWVRKSLLSLEAHLTAD